MTHAAESIPSASVPGAGRLRVVVVDDRRPVVGSLADFLHREQFVVQVTSTVDDTLRSALHHDPDLVVLDRAIPACRQLRSVTNAYIVVLSARQRVLDAIGAPVAAYAVIADPISPRELAARIRTLVRRPALPTTSTTTGSAQPASRAVGALGIDVAHRRAHLHGSPVALTRIEFHVLAALASRPGAVLTRRQLIAAVWGESRPITSQLVKVHIGRLRRKLGDDPIASRYVTTVRGSGYRLANK